MQACMHLLMYVRIHVYEEKYSMGGSSALTVVKITAGLLHMPYINFLEVPMSKFKNLWIGSTAICLGSEVQKFMITSHGFLPLIPLRS